MRGHFIGPQPCGHRCATLGAPSSVVLVKILILELAYVSSRLILNPGELVRQRPAGIPQCASIVVTLWLSLLSLGSAAMAQKTVVVDAAGGMKEELVYDSSGRVVETRTLDANGKVQVRSIFDFPSGFYAERRHTTTSYGPDGRSVQSASTEDYDENANFTQEVIALY